jgi:hypothetical protein
MSGAPAAAAAAAAHADSDAGLLDPMMYVTRERTEARRLARMQAGALDGRQRAVEAFASARPFTLYTWCEEPVAGGLTESTLRGSDAALTVGARGLLPLLEPVPAGGEVRCSDSVGPRGQQGTPPSYWPEDHGALVGATGMPFDACTRASCRGGNFSRGSK